jgi:hypothetical protein
MELIYYGEEISKKTGNWFAPFTALPSVTGMFWSDVQNLLMQGVEVRIRPATDMEYFDAEAIAAIHKAKGAAFTHAPERVQ